MGLNAGVVLMKRVEAASTPFHKTTQDSGFRPIPLPSSGMYVGTPSLNYDNAYEW